MVNAFVEQWLASCWPWPQSRGSHGYPQATDPRPGRRAQSTTAHRAMFITVFGWEPEEVHHVCEHGRSLGCVNPFHLQGLTSVEHGRITAGVLPGDRCGRCGESNWRTYRGRKTRMCWTCHLRSQRDRRRRNGQNPSRREHAVGSR